MAWLEQQPRVLPAPQLELQVLRPEQPPVPQAPQLSLQLLLAG